MIIQNKITMTKKKNPKKQKLKQNEQLVIKRSGVVFELKEIQPNQLYSHFFLVDL